MCGLDVMYVVDVLGAASRSQFSGGAGAAVGRSAIGHSAIKWPSSHESGN